MLLMNPAMEVVSKAEMKEKLDLTSPTKLNFSLKIP